MMVKDSFLKAKNYNAMEEDEQGNENANVNTTVDVASLRLSHSQSSVDSVLRSPLSTILPETTSQIHLSSDNDTLPPISRSKFDRTPTKPKNRNFHDSGLPLRTPDRYGGGGIPRQRFGWTQKNVDDHMGFTNMTPRSIMATNRTVKTNSDYSESVSAQSTPSKSVSKPSIIRSAVASRVGNGGGLTSWHRGPLLSGDLNQAEVPHFELKEDPLFWMEHNVQVLVRVRPLNTMERSVFGSARCLRQDGSQTITWTCQPETRFVFDHVACETIDQEALFRMAGLPMVENCLSGYNSCIFAYGQTGSGKTYTMLGEVDNLEYKPSPNRGMTPRIFEFLFARIQAEEESRKDEKLKYNCKCSFIEIYNEQITDLLDPSSSNLLLREDVKDGVYVENLSEYEVYTVGDVMKLLSQGSLNRKVAVTNMNRESSRSHCVFTCVIESRWEKDSTTNLRFARLNLVDLAGSERQKSSGAEGDRLKEAANINKSLSTLGHVIMILVDVANGKQRHVPYRDSRLTFLLQDSLGGNSKTMIFANVSPSIGCAAETLNTLKFAQRAKLIKNNAVVNEDSTGDVLALQHQIRLLKAELSLLKCQIASNSVPLISNAFAITDEEETVNTNNDNDDDGVRDFVEVKTIDVVNSPETPLQTLESILAGALRREKNAEESIKTLKAEIEHLNRLVRQREEDTRSTKMMLRFREDKIQRMESVVNELLPSDSYLMEENRSLLSEIQLLQNKVEKNPEVTRFALENIRLLDQLRRFKELYEEGEKELLMDELKIIRGQLLLLLSGKSLQHSVNNCELMGRKLPCQEELNVSEDCNNKLILCLEENEKLKRKLFEMQETLKFFEFEQNTKDGNSKAFSKAKNFGNVTATSERNFDTNGGFMSSNSGEDILNMQLEIDILKIILKEERSLHVEAVEKSLCLGRDLELVRSKLLATQKECEDAFKELTDSKAVISALESEHLFAIEELDDLKKRNSAFADLLRDKEREIERFKDHISALELKDHHSVKENTENFAVQQKLKKMQASLERAKRLNNLYQKEHACKESTAEEMDEIRRQAEAETAEVIVSLQDELCLLQNQVQDCSLKGIETKQVILSMETEVRDLHDKIRELSNENENFRLQLEHKDKEIGMFSQEWEFLACEMDEILVDVQEAMTDASDQLDMIRTSVPRRRSWMIEKMDMISRIVSQKDFLIAELGKRLEDANSQTIDLEFKLQSLRGALMAINEEHREEYIEKEKEVEVLKLQLSKKDSSVLKLKEKLKLIETQAINASKCATVAFVTMKHLAESMVSSSCEVEAECHRSIAFTVQRLDENMEEKNGTLSEVVELKDASRTLQRKLEDKKKQSVLLEHSLQVVEPIEEPNVKDKVYELYSIVGTNSDFDNISICHKINGEFHHETFDNSECSGSNCCSANYPKYTGPKLGLGSASESILQCLNAIQTAVIKHREERDTLWMSERQHNEKMQILSGQIYSFQAVMQNFEEQILAKFDYFDCKMKSIEQNFLEVHNSWCQAKEFLELETEDAKVYATQNAAEASCIYAKFEEAQDTLKEADIMLNGLMIANEKAKLDAERSKQTITRLTSERCKLIDSVQTLQSLNAQKDRHINNLEGEYISDMAEMKTIIAELEMLVSEIQASNEESFICVQGDIQKITAISANYGKLVKTWIEGVWSEIIEKDCSMSVFHLCHLGIMLEAVTGVNTENYLLRHGLCQSNSIISDLKSYNSKTNSELQMFSALKGKLLVDIKSAFDRISKGEEKTNRFCNELRHFESKILDLQHQEESMVQRANHMGSQLALFMEELNLNNRGYQEFFVNGRNMLKQKEDVMNSQFDILLEKFGAKEIELCMMESALRELSVEKTLSEMNNWSALEKLKSDLLVSKFNIELNEHETQLLNNECIELKCKSDLLLCELKDTSSRILELEKINITLAHDASDAAAMNDILRAELAQNVQLKFNIEKKLETLESEREVLKIEFLEDLARSEKRLAIERNNVESLIENCMQVIIISMVEKDLNQQLLVLEESKSSILTDRIESAQLECRNLYPLISQINARSSDLEKVNLSLLCRINEIEIANDKLRLDLYAKEVILDSSSNVLDAESQSKKFEADVSLLESSLYQILEERESNIDERFGIGCLEIESRALEHEIRDVKSDIMLIFDEIMSESNEVKKFLNDIKKIDSENSELQERYVSLDVMTSVLIGQWNAKQAGIGALVSDLSIKNKEIDNLHIRMTNLEDDDLVLRNTVQLTKKDIIKILKKMDFNNERCMNVCILASSDSRKLIEVFLHRGIAAMEKMLIFVSESDEKLHFLMEEVAKLEFEIMKMIHDEIDLKAELYRKEDILNGVLFDMSLLQESASSLKDQKDKLENSLVTSEALKLELKVKSRELDDSEARYQSLDRLLHEKIVLISNLESQVLHVQQSLTNISHENSELGSKLEEAILSNHLLEEEVAEKRTLIENLEASLSKRCEDIGEMLGTIDSMKSTMFDLKDENNRLSIEISSMNDKLEKAQAWGETNEAVALEAKQISDSMKTYANEKEAEVKLLESSIEELECTIDVLENKVEILKGEAERQRLQREELEVELIAVNHQMQNLKSSDAETKRYLEKKERALEQAQKYLKSLEKDLVERDKEIAECKAHISDLNIHAEAQACEYKQKFKELEAMAESVKLDEHYGHAGNSSSNNKSEKHSNKSRGSGSPFKCIGLGLSQQVKLEKHEELTAAKLQIEELQSQAVGRQKEIFALNARLAAAESMTHDVIRDLLGVKLDITNYASIMDNQQSQKQIVRTQSDCLDPQMEEEHEVVKLKQQLNEFIDERRQWLEEIEHNQKAIAAARSSVEKIREQNQSLKAGNEALKTENEKCRESMVVLEGKVKNSGQQNFHLQIHHHAKIKEENNYLKLQNEDLTAKLNRAEFITARLKQELARCGAADSRNFDEEQQLLNRLKETEDSKMQLAQQLLAICTSILKVAGTVRAPSEINSQVAEEALQQVSRNICSLERQVEHLAQQNRVVNEKVRLLEMKARNGCASFMSDFDR